MQDEKENPASNEVAPQENETQNEQVAPTDESANAPEVQSEKEELILGKFKSQDELAKSYQELEQKTTKTAQEKAQLEKIIEQISSQEPQQEANDDIALDPSVIPALDKWYREKEISRLQYEELRKAQEFEKKHIDELKDPALAGTVKQLISEARLNNEYLDQEEALVRAKEILDDRVKAKIKEAQSQGEQIGSQIAGEKAKLGNVGQTAPSQKVNPDELSADEYAKYFNIPRA